MVTEHFTVFADPSIAAPILGLGVASCVLVLLLLLLWFCYSREGVPLLRFYSTAAITLYALSLLSCLVAVLISPSDTNSATETFCLCTSDVLWTLATAMCYLQWIKRMKLCFLNTPHQPSPRVYSAMNCGIATFIVLQLLMILNIVLWQSNAESIEVLNDYDIFNLLIKSVNHTVISVYIFCLFLSGLRRITVDIFEEDSAGWDPICSPLDTPQMSNLMVNPDDMLPDTQDLQQWMMMTKTKYAVLFITMLVVSEFCIMLDVAVGFAYLAAGHKNVTLDSWNVKWVFLTMDCVAMSICIFFTFEFADEYYQFVCRPCHSCSKRHFNSVKVHSRRGTEYEYSKQSVNRSQLRQPLVDRL